MSAPSDPRIRRLRGVLGSSVRDGNVEGAAEARRQIANILALRALADVAPTLTPQERAEFASVIFTAGGEE